MLLKSFIIFTFAGLYAAFADPSGLSPRITNGVPVNSISKYPYTAVIRRNIQFICPAVIIGPNLALTTGQCAKKLRGGLLTLTAGSLTRRLTPNGPNNHLQVRVITKVTIHEDYQRRAFHDNDIAKLTLRSDLVFNDFVKPIQLADAKHVGEKVDFAGWGRDAHFKEVQSLVSGSGVVQSEEECKKAFEPKEPITDTTGCAKSADEQVVCGDSGTPVVLRVNDRTEDDRLVGIASHTELVNTGGRRLCDITKPSLFTDVVALRAWIVAPASN